MKLALRRSIAFWSGLLVLAFLGWAWLYSLNRIAHIGRDQCFVGVDRSRVFLQWSDGGKGIPLDRGVMELPEGIPIEAFPAPGYHVEEWSSMPLRIFFVPFWMLVIAFALPWAGLLVLRARRRKGKMMDPS